VSRTQARYRKSGRSRLRIGIDIGRVIIDGNREDMLRPVTGVRRSESFFGIPAVPGAFRTIERLVKRFGTENIHLVSTCSQTNEKKVRMWFIDRGFYKATGVLQDHVIFCRTFEAKAKIAESLRLTHFIDDRPDVLDWMKKVVRVRILFRPEEKEIRRFEGAPEGVIETSVWRAAFCAIFRVARSIEGAAGLGAYLMWVPPFFYKKENAR